MFKHENKANLSAKKLKEKGILTPFKANLVIETATIYLKKIIGSHYRYVLTFSPFRWFAKKVDYSTPMYNDSVLYRQEYSYYHNVSNTYRSNLYNTQDGLPQRNISLISKPSRFVLFSLFVRKYGIMLKNAKEGMSASTFLRHLCFG